MLRINKLLAGLDQLTLIAPQGEMPEGATIAGELPENLRQLSTLTILKGREVERLELEHRHSDDELEQDKLVNAHAIANAEYAVLRDILWLEIRASFNLLGVNQVGVASDWRVWSLNQCRCNLCQLERAFGRVAAHDQKTGGEQPEAPTDDVKEP